MIKYSALFIDIDQVLVPKGTYIVPMVQQLQRMSNKCNEVAMSVPAAVPTVPQDPLSFFPARPDAQRALIIVIPWDLVQQYTASREDVVFGEFNNGNAFRNSLGHCYVTWDKTKDICGMWDICLHEQHHGKGGLGSILTDSILESLMMQLPNTTTLWLGIDLRNNHFAKVVSLYAKHGFAEPFISYADSFKYQWRSQLPYGFISMHRTNDYIDPADINREGVMNDVLYMVTQYVKVQKIRNDMASVREVAKGVKADIDLGAENFCTIRARFNTPYARWLSKVPLAASTLNANGSVTQKEVGGAFMLDNPKLQGDGTMIWDITVDKSRGLNVTHEESVEMKIGRYNFHTHPREAYGRHGVPIGYPSGADYFAFFFATFTNHTVFHCVIALEGVYTISLSPYWTTRMAELRALAEGYPGGAGAFNSYMNQHMELPKVIPLGMDAVQAGRDYCEQIKQLVVFPGYTPVYNCTFLTWGEVFQGNVVGIAYPVLFSQCFATERALVAVQRFYPEAFLDAPF